MKFALIFLLLISKVCHAQDNVIYYTPLKMPESFDFYYTGAFDIKLLAEDLAELLSQSTGKNFIVKPYTNQKEGIFLLLDSSINSHTNETGYLEIKEKSITISAKYITGISYGMYSWLDEIGFKFYLPGDNWNIIPNLNKIYKPINKTYQPYFKLRTFTASGRLFPVKGLDENSTIKNEWFKWFRRNRMGSDYIGIDGHKGELFNSVFKNDLENDSTMLAPINGKRQYSVNAKLDPTNKKTLSLFINWTLDRAKSEKLNNPYFLPYKKYTSVDMGDGLNYCHTPECEKAFGSVSNQAISIANEAAIKIKSVDKNAGVSTLAYTERADTPSIKIEPNVHVMVVPTAFQNITTASNLMLRWTKKTSNVSMYDYLNIGVWNYDMPFYNLNDYFKYLNYLKTLKIEGVAYETSYSKFGAGIQQYFILKYLCEPYSDPEKLLEEFCLDMFGNAAKSVKSIFKEWYFSDVHLKTNFDNPSFYPDELGRFISKIIQAETSTGLNPAQQSRIYELKAYIIYLCKYYELFQDPILKLSYINDVSVKQKKVDDLLNYIWSIYNKMIFQNTQLNDLLKPISSNKNNWDYKISSTFSKYSSTNNQYINSEFENVKNIYLPQLISLPKFDSSIFKTLTIYSSDSLRFETIDEESFAKFVYAIPFYCSKPGIIKIKYKSGLSKIPSKANKNLGLISIESDDYNFISNNFIKYQNIEGEINIEIPASGFYKLNLGQFYSTKIEFIVYPGSNLIYLNKKSILSNAFSLQENPQSAYSNAGIYFLSPADNKITVMPLKANTKLTYSFFNSSKIPLITNLILYPKYITIPFTNAQKTNFMYYKNDVIRWQPLFINTQPYLFFLK
ncbi:MAG: DUF4838 domain-containing protein [Ferruginibacter sp.]